MTTEHLNSRLSEGPGPVDPDRLGACGQGTVIEDGVRVFHPENVKLGHDVYIGHDTILKGYHLNELHIGSGTWVGQQCFFHSAGGLTIGENVGIGPGVKIITSLHQEQGRQTPILHSPLEFASVQVQDDADLGVGSIVLPGVTVGRGAQVGAGAVVTADVPEYAIVAGVPARVLRLRPEADRT